MKEFNKAVVRKILIRSVNWIGDAVMTTPAIGAVREQFPQAEITLLANAMVSQLFIPHEWVDRVITFDRTGLHRGITGRLRLASELKKERFDVAVILPNSFDSALVPWLAGIPVMLGRRSDGRSLLLTHRYSAEKRSDWHEVEYYLDLLSHFGINGRSVSPYLVTTKEEELNSTELLSDNGISEDDFVLGINPGATYGSAKRWYPERFAEVARRLVDELGAKVVIFGGPGEKDIASEIELAMKGNCLNMAGRTGARELMALIKPCNFMVTNDSGPMHIAAAF
ncbi:MAG: lipopolysaccharide heptosyltransferase II, partial [Deltaproteobacteria bacterium]